MKMNTGRDDFEIEFEDDDLTMTLPEEMAYDQNWAFTKFSLVTTLRGLQSRLVGDKEFSSS